MKGRKKQPNSPPIPSKGQLVTPNYPADSRPIDSPFWFKLSRTWVTDSRKDLQAKAESVRKGVVWFFGLGSSFTFGALLLDKEFTKLIDPIYFIVPAGLLFLSYAFTVFSDAFSIRSKIKIPNNAEHIRQSYNGSVLRAKLNLVLAAVFLFLGFICFPIILGMGLVKEKPTGYSFTAVYTKGVIPKSKDYLLREVAVSEQLKQSGPFWLSIENGRTFAERKSLSKNLFVTLPDSSFHIVDLKISDTIRGDQKIFAFIEYKHGTQIESVVKEIKESEE